MRDKMADLIYDTWIGDVKHYDSYAMERASKCADSILGLLRQGPTASLCSKHGWSAECSHNDGGTFHCIDYDTGEKGCVGGLYALVLLPEEDE